MVRYNHWHRRSLQPLENWDFLASFLNKGFVGTGPLFLRPRYGFLLYYISTNDQQSYLFLVHREITRDFLQFQMFTKHFRIFVVFTNCTRKQTQPKKNSTYFCKFKNKICIVNKYSLSATLDMTAGKTQFRLPTKKGHRVSLCIFQQPQ